MRVFSQINNCQQKQNKTKQTNKNRQIKKGAPLLGLAKSIYYIIKKALRFLAHSWHSLGSFLEKP